MNDPYSVLGISRGATDDEIKKAYRALSRKYHPDANINNPNKDQAEAKFKEVQQAYQQIMQERSYGGSADGNGQGGYNGDPFGGFWQYGGFNTQQRQETQEDTHMQAAANYINNGYYQEALNVLSGISSRNARWYYLSALANSGVGNNVKAQEDISEAVRLEPNNFQYQSLKQRLEGGTGWYQKQSTVYGRPDFSGQDWCMKMCLLNLLCNCCCNRGMCCGTPIGYR